METLGPAIYIWNNSKYALVSFQFGGAHHTSNIETEIFQMALFGIILVYSNYSTNIGLCDAI